VFPVFLVFAIVGGIVTRTVLVEQGYKAGTLVGVAITVAILVGLSLTQLALARAWKVWGTK
jgi:uncharacterized protein (DUF983 family)